MPLVGEYVVGPEVVEVDADGAFSSEDNEEGVEKLGCVVGALPGGLFGWVGEEGSPDFGVEVEDAEGVVAGFVV